MDEVVQSMTDFDLFANLSKHMEEDKVICSKSTPPEIAQALFPHQEFSSSYSKSASVKDTSPILSSKEGTS